MNIVHVISGDLWGGAEAQALTLLTQLSKHPQFKVHAIVLNHGQLERRLQAAKISVTVLDERQHSSVALLFRLFCLLRRIKPDVVHTHRIKENILGSIAARLAGCPLSIRTVHGQDEHVPALSWRTLPAQFLRRLDQWCATRLQRTVIAVSDELGLLLKLAMPDATIEVIPNGVDVQSLFADVEQNPQPGLSQDQIHVALIGRLVAVKRPDIFLNMAKVLLQHPYRSWRFHVLGDGPLAAALIRQAADLGISAHMHFHGHCTPASPWLVKMHVVVMCSDHEGLPMVALEALALGVPVVAHCTGGLKQVLPPQNLVTTHTAAGYAEKLRHLFRADSSIAAPVAVPLPDNCTAPTNATSVASLYAQLLGRQNLLQETVQR